MNVFGKTVSRAIAAGAVVLAAAPLATLSASAESQQLTPFRCFTQNDNVHVVFGPASFFTPPTQQGPTSFKENGGPTVVTYPLYHGTSQGRAVKYVITDASSLSAAQVLGVNYVPKLAQAVGTAAVQNSDSAIGTGHGIDFPASVDFSPQHVITPDPVTGFPPIAAQPGAMGETGYSPLVQVTFRDTKVVLNAPQIANASGQADKVVSIDNAHQVVSYRETDGCYDNESVHYASFDASDFGAAAIEDVTYAPALGSAPSLGCADAAVVAANCSRESLIAFINGQTGMTNPERQGLNAALLDGHSPLNILKEIPEPTAQFDYSPLWDIHLVRWNDSVPVANRLRQTDFATAQALVGTQAQSLTPSGLSNMFGATGFIVNCPVVSLDVNPSR
jgi:hypothetical protein